MGDVARCRCPHDSQNVKCGVSPACPIHGYSAPNPLKPYVLTAGDKELLKSLRIAVLAAGEIEELRQADEDRFRRD